MHRQSSASRCRRFDGTTLTRINTGRDREWDQKVQRASNFQDLPSFLKCEG